VGKLTGEPPSARLGLGTFAAACAGGLLCGRILVYFSAPLREGGQVNRLRVQEQAALWCTAASVVVVGMGLVSVPVDVDRTVLRPELHAGVVLESAETGLSALVSAAMSPPAQAEVPAVVPANVDRPAVASSLWCTGGGCFDTNILVLGYVFIAIGSVLSAPFFFVAQLASAIRSWVQQVTDSVKAFVATIFPPSASARPVSPPAAARRSSASGVAAAATVSAAVANHAAAQASSAAGALPARSLERTAAPHRRGGVPAAAAHQAASPHAAAAARPARAATRSVAHAAAATPRTGKDFRR